jgi:hypothetical protein
VTIWLDPREVESLQTETERAQRSEHETEPEVERLARVLGPTIMAVTSSEALNYDIWNTQLPAVTYLNGLFLFVAGVSILQKEHRWSRRWPVLITMLGWIATVGGLARLFAPRARQPAESAGIDVFLTGGFLVGCFLTYKAYWRRKRG